MRKIFAFVCSTALVMSLVSCSASSGSTAAEATTAETTAETTASEAASSIEETDTASANETIYGEVTAINGNTVTVKAGTAPGSVDPGASISLAYTGQILDITIDDSVTLMDMSMNEDIFSTMQGGGSVPGIPGEDQDSDDEPYGVITGGLTTDGQTAESNSQAEGQIGEGFIAGGQDQQGGSVPSMPDGSAPTMADGSVPSMPDGSAPTNEDGSAPSMPDGMTFNDWVNGITIDVSDLAVGDIVAITYDENGTVTSVSRVDLRMIAMGNMKGNPMNSDLQPGQVDPNGNDGANGQIDPNGKDGASGPFDPNKNSGASGQFDPNENDGASDQGEA